MDRLDPQSIPDHILFGRSKAMQEVRQAVQNVSDASVPILLQGERGTGKEVIGREIHRRSLWQRGPFTKVGDATQTSPSIHEAVCPSADSSSPWWTFRVLSLNSAPGTLFFDEVGELDLALQAKLLEFFPEEPARYPSDQLNNPVYPRVICATHRHLERDVAAGSFRPDLFYRINVMTIQFPSLRDRKEDIPDLADYFFEVSCGQQNRRCPAISSELLDVFCNYDWPGNIRELETCVKAYVSVSTNSGIVEELLSKGATGGRSQTTGQPKSSVPLRAYTRKVLEQTERALIYQALIENNWNRKEAAKALQISYQTLLHKLKQAGFNKKREAVANRADDPV